MFQRCCACSVSQQDPQGVACRLPPEPRNLGVQEIACRFPLCPVWAGSKEFDNNKLSTSVSTDRDNTNKIEVLACLSPSPCSSGPSPRPPTVERVSGLGFGKPEASEARGPQPLLRWWHLQHMMSSHLEKSCLNTISSSDSQSVSRCLRRLQLSAPTCTFCIEVGKSCNDCRCQRLCNESCKE
jgi:hypothetical protein